MCGITGFWRLGPLQDGDRAALKRSIESLEHRGPDGWGEHVDPGEGLAMGHTRLSIIDLSGGHQPLHAPDGDAVLTVNGEFYDYKTLRTGLITEGARFATKSDSEVALHLYRRHGLDFVHFLRGEFAFALHDARKDRLILVRDRFGIKPLYVHLRPDRVHWGSEVKSLLPQPGVPRRLDHRAALNQLMHVMVPGTTAFEGIEQVRPGHMLVIQRRPEGFDVKDLQWWDMDFPAAEEHRHGPSEEECIQEVRERLIDAVRVRLEADVPVGCYLSGGIDSCSMLGLATPLQQSPVKAFTISFDHDDYDEAAIAREMAASVGADHEVMELKAEDLYGESYVTTVRHAERTFYNTLGVAKWHMSRRVRELGYKSVVTGEGSDELFGGYPFFKRDHFLHGLKDLGQGAGVAGNNAVFKGSIVSEQSASHPAFDQLVGFTPSWIQPWILTLELARPLLSGSVRSELEGYDPVAAVAGTLDPGRLAGRHPLDRSQYTWIKTMLEGQILTWGGDRVDMANSMESRPAFLDHRLADFTRLLPPAVRIKDGVEKWVLREAMKGVLPRVLYERQKFAFMAPPSHTDPRKRAAVEKIIHERLSPERIDAAGLFSPDRVDGFLQLWRRSEGDDETAWRRDIVLNHVLGLQILHQELVEGGSPAPVA